MRNRNSWRNTVAPLAPAAFLRHIVALPASAAFLRYIVAASAFLPFYLFTLLFLCACGSDDYTYSNYHCNLYIDNSTHQDATLASAMNPASPGVFCKISYSASTRSYVFSSNQGGSSTSVFDARDTERGNSSRIGMNNGLFVGYGNLSANETGGYTFYAFDAQCPNCFDYNSIPMRSYPLTMNTAGIATCDNCKRQYNMNTGGNCVNDSGKGMTLYRATTTGALGMLFVN